jgi:hypothetical protein
LTWQTVGKQADRQSQLRIEVLGDIETGKFVYHQIVDFNAASLAAWYLAVYLVKAKQDGLALEHTLSLIRRGTSQYS